MLSAVYFLAQTLLSLLFGVFAVRLILQVLRADFRNPIAQAILRLTNPVILPLRRVFPPAGKFDTASILAVVVVLIAEVGILSLLRSGDLPGPLAWLQAAVVEGLRATLWLYFYAIFIYALLSLAAPGNHSPLQGLLSRICEPVLRPFRRIIPALAGLDLSPLWAGITIQMLLILLR